MANPLLPAFFNPSFTPLIEASRAPFMAPPASFESIPIALRSAENPLKSTLDKAFFIPSAPSPDIFNCSSSFVRAPKAVLVFKVRSSSILAAISSAFKFFFFCSPIFLSFSASGSTFSLTAFIACPISLTVPPNAFFAVMLILAFVFASNLSNSSAVLASPPEAETIKLPKPFSKPFIPSLVSSKVPFIACSIKAASLPRALEIIDFISELASLKPDIP